MIVFYLVIKKYPEISFRNGPENDTTSLSRNAKILEYSSVINLKRNLNAFRVNFFINCESHDKLAISPNYVGLHVEGKEFQPSPREN